ncbi:MAG TPA: hypothetical protein VNA69_24345 [Thermoanaerobaculia bacterium]|nr:hypothetical protein [Thermoanaerobaculia bacterium]
MSPALQQSIAETRARVRVGYPWWLHPWLARDVAAITLGRTIYLREWRTGNPACPDRRDRLSPTERLLRHELVHVRQVNRLGLFVFLWRYMTEFLAHFWRERSIARAYRRISFEVEAWAEEEREAV